MLEKGHERTTGSNTEYKSRARFLTVCVVIMFISTVFMFIMLMDVDRRSFQSDEESRRERQELKEDVAELRHKGEQLDKEIKALTVEVERDRKTYGYRGIVQKMMKNRMIELGLFSKEMARMLEEVSEHAGYPR